MLSGKCKITRRERRLRLARIAEKLHVLQSNSEGLSAYRAKQEQPEERLSAQENVLQRLRRGEGDFILRSGYRTELRMAKGNE